MVTLEVGRVVMKIAGREAGRYAVVIKKLDENFVMITGPKPLTGVKRRRANVDHLQPTPYKLEIKEDASESEVVKAWEKSGLLSKLGLKKPSPEKVKEAEKKVKEKQKKEEAKAEDKSKEATEKKKKEEPSEEKKKK